jgi:hypothetical protein
MIANIASTQGAPHSHEFVVVLALIVVFLVVEILLILSIFRDDREEGEHKKTFK